MSLKGGGKSAVEIQEEWLDGMTMHFGCTFCSWTFDGGLKQGRAESQKHRTQKHPEIPPYRRQRRRGAGIRPNWRSDISEEERKEVDIERRRRAAEIGVDIE